MTTKAQELVTSFKVSQKLKELGIPHGQSYFVWCDLRERRSVGKNIEVIPREFANTLDEECEILCDAFTVNEMFKLFPKIGVYPSIEFLGKNYVAQYNEGNEFFFEEYNENPADSLAEILCRIIRNESFQEYMETNINPQDLKL